MPFSRTIRLEMPIAISKTGLAFLIYLHMMTVVMSLSAPVDLVLSPDQLQEEMWSDGRNFTQARTQLSCTVHLWHVMSRFEYISLSSLVDIPHSSNGPGEHRRSG